MLDPDFESRANALVAASDGRIWINSGYRSYEEQERLWNEAVAKHGPDEARNWAAPPGYSFHEKGQAIDFGGDLELLAQLAPQYGLWQPMSWEDWHYEPIGSRDGSESPLSMSERPTNPSALVRGIRTRDYADVMQNVLGIRPYQSPQSTADMSLTRGGTDPIIAGNPGFLTPALMDIFGPLKEGLTTRVPGTGVSRTYNPNSSPGSTDLEKFMYALRDVESSHNYRAVGVPTPWGTAKGAYQYLDSTWDNYGGYASADLAPPEVQDQKAREDMQRYYDEYQSWDSVAAAWYSGPGGNWESDEVQQYIGKVNSRL